MGNEKKENKAERGGFVGVLWSTGRLVPIILAVVIGIVLLVLGSMGGEDEKESAPNLQSESCESSVSGVKESVLDYESQLEARIGELCSRVAGVGEVSVSVYINEVFDYVDAGGADSGYVTLAVPKISGIGVVCDGGNDPSVKKELTMLISTAFCVGSNKIYITGT
jgi:hypothetical protein